MAECIAQLALNFHPTHPITVAFDAPHISSDGGALLLRQMDDRHGIEERLAALLPDECYLRKVKHRSPRASAAAALQIALGYTRRNDADRLRQDPVLKKESAIGLRRRKASLRKLASPRLENAVDIGRHARACHVKLRNSNVRSFTKAPEVIILDIDSTDDPTTGNSNSHSSTGMTINTCIIPW